MVLEVGSRLGPYQILAPLGAGGMGVVYRARDTKLHRDVALKVLCPGKASDAEALARFEREARLVASLSHPNILAIHDFGRVDDQSFAVMELLEGETLREWLSREGALPTRKTVEYAVQVALGLAAAHEKGIVHRDLKPENVFLTRDGRLKILDFGLARLDEPVLAQVDSRTLTRHTEPGRVLGTVGYMSPEQVRGLPVDPRSDIFSLGAILYEMLTGSRAFQESTPADTLSAILHREPAPLTVQGRPCPASLERIVDSCLEKRADERFRSAHDVALALVAVSAEPGHDSSRQIQIRPSARRRSWAAAAAAIAGLGLGLVVWALASRTPRPDRAISYRELTWSGLDSSPAVSPDGRMVAFRSERDGVPRIWLKQLGGEGERALTEGPDDDFPRFSPNSAEVLFLRSEPSGKSLYRVPVLGGLARRVVENANEGDWTPDGTGVLFVRDVERDGRAASTLALAAQDGSGVRSVADLDFRVERPRVAPDGKKVATIPVAGSLPGGAAQAIVLSSLEGGAVRMIDAPDRRHSLSAPAWASGDELVYAQAESVVDAAGSTARIIHQDALTGRILSSTWSPDRALVLDIVGPGHLVFDSRDPRQNLRETPLRGGEARWLSRGRSTDRQPAYSRDGDWVVFSSNRGGNLDLWAVSTRTGWLRRLTEDEASDWDPAFAPSGRLLWSSDRTGNFEIWSAAGDGSAPRRVTHDGGPAENPTITPDEQWIVYSSGNTRHSGLWKVRPDGSGATQLAQGLLSIPEVSPDGRFVLYRVGASGQTALIRVVRLDGTPVPFEIRVETRRRTSNILGRARWMPDGRIAFVGQDERGVNGILVQDFSPGRDTSATRRPLGGFDAETAAESFAIAPDGSRMVVAGWVQLFSLIEARGLPGLLRLARPTPRP